MGKAFERFQPQLGEEKIISHTTIIPSSLYFLCFIKVVTSGNLAAAMEQMGKAFQRLQPRLGEEKIFSHHIVPEGNLGT